MPDDLTTSSSDYADTPVLQLDSPLDCSSLLNTSTTESLSGLDMDTPATISVELCSDKVIDMLNTAGWNFNLENVNTFSSPVSLSGVSHSPGITTTAATGKVWHCSWMLNHPTLCFLVNEKYYSDYAGIFGMMGIPCMSQPQWDKVVTWLGEHVIEETEIS